MSGRVFHADGYVDRQSYGEYLLFPMRNGRVAKSEWNIFYLFPPPLSLRIQFIHYNYPICYKNLVGGVCSV